MVFDNSIKVVVGIDFGTTYSGYAYAFVTDKKIVARNNWFDKGQSDSYIKTPTEILYKFDKNHATTFETWGSKAQQTFTQLNKERRSSDYWLLKKFKLALVEGRDLVKGEPHIVKHKQLYNVLEIISDYLRGLKDVILDDIRKATSGKIEPEEIGWCLTVPAIWKDVEKAFMRKAAQKAGIVTTEGADRKRLIFAYEPEAAALYCMAEEKMQLLEGQQFMTVDCGGGTVDITTHRVMANLQLEEIGKGCGGLCGSTYVDGVFMDYLRYRFDNHVFLQELEATDVETYFDLVKAWEVAKRGYNPAENHKNYYVEINSKLHRFLQKHNLIEALKASQDGDEDSIVVSVEDMQKIFEPVLSKIERLINESFEAIERAKANPLTYIYLVGGFGMSPAVQQMIEEKFGHKVLKVVIPRLGGEAIVKGAVAFALEPNRAVRKSRFTYGTNVVRLFEHGIDDIRKKYVDYRGLDYCHDRMDILVRVGKIMKLNECVTESYVPTSPNQTTMGFRIFSTEKPNPRYTDEENVSQIGYLSVSREDISKGTNWSVKFRMYFGGTEIHVEAEDETGQKVETKLNFDFDY